MYKPSPSHIGDSTKFLQKLNQAIDLITHNFDTQKIFLFGSFAKGTNVKSSSIDLFVIANTDIKFIERLEFINDIFGRNHIRSECIIYTQSELDRKLQLNDSFISNIIETSVQVFPN